jgi:hypothetical protein
MSQIKYGKLVIIGAGHVGSAILISNLRMNFERILELPLDGAGHKDLLICYEYLHEIITSIQDMI